MKKFLVMLALVSGVVQAEYDSTEFTKQVEACAKIKAVESVEQFKELTSKFEDGLYGITRAWAMDEKIINPPKVEDMKACNEILSKYVEVLKNGN
ncbi:thioredoxin [Aeromonas phage AhSzw-1]|uniref:Thioredoxin n=1 Tax=Aeromonas phage AhSzw-1 TaxID=2138299 RepID=A0A2R4AM17_9CAUD|nr:thioredoxin [Aeromonas phage AhSzw-1]AVR76046.1 thioredoxin [Aeromonas phage AhSzw-1]